MNQLRALVPTRFNPRLLLVLIIACGLLLRLYKFESRLAFDFDNEFFAWEAKKIIIDQNLTLIGQESSFFGIFIGPVYTYISALFYWLFAMHPVGAGYLSILFGIATTVSLYLIGKYILSPAAGLVSAFIYQFSLYTVIWDQGASALSGMYLLPLLWFYTSIRLQEKNMFFLHFLILGLLLHFHPTSIILIFSSIILLIITRPQNLRRLFTGVALFLLTLSPLLIFEIRNSFLIAKTIPKLLNYSGPSNTSVYAAWKVLSQSLTRWADFNSQVSIPILFLLLFPVLLLFIWKYSSNLNIKKSFSVYFIILLVTFLLLLVGHKISDYYPMVIFAPTLVILGLVIELVYRARYIGRIAASAFLIIFFITNLSNWYSYQKMFSLAEKTTVVKWVISDSKNRPFILSDSLIKLGYNTGYNYLFWFYGANINPPSPEIIYSLVIPPDYLGTTSTFQTSSIGVVSDPL